MSGPRIVYLVTEDWYFLSHRLPMARAARDAGFDVHVATRLTDGEAAIAAEGFTPHGLNWRRGSLAPVANARAVRDLRALLASLSPDILHNIALKPVVLGSLAAGRNGPAVVNSMTGMGTLFVSNTAKLRTVRALLGPVLRLILSRPRTRAVVQNGDDRDALQALGAPSGSIVLIPGSGVDTDRLTPLAEPGGPVTAAYAGRMLDDKGVRTLRTAFRMLRAQGDDVALLLAGRCDPENPRSLTDAEMHDWAREPGVTWLGHVDDVADVWARAHFAVLPSRREGLPLSLLEAAACGRAMVATDAPGCREIARNGETALTVPVDDAGALAGAMTAMAADPAMRQRYGAAARALAETVFSARAIGGQTAALYRSLIKAD